MKLNVRLRHLSIYIYIISKVFLIIKTLVSWYLFVCCTLRFELFMIFNCYINMLELLC